MLDELPDTRAIEAKAIIRGFVRSAEPAGQSSNGLSFRTTDGVSTVQTAWGDAEPRLPEETAGALCIEAVSDDVLRIRYWPGGDDVDDRDLGLVVGTLPEPTAVEVGGTSLRTPAMTVEVGLNPFSVTIRSPSCAR